MRQLPAVGREVMGMLEKIRAWLTPALLAVIALLLYRLIDAVEDVADSIDDASTSAESPDGRIAGAWDQ
jgi:hypothetical protein